MATARATRATPTRLHARAVADWPAEPPAPEQAGAEPATALRGEYLTEREYQALLALVRSGGLPPDATSRVWPGEARTRWIWVKVAGGLVVWALAGVGLWCLVT